MNFPRDTESMNEKGCLAVLRVKSMDKLTAPVGSPIMYRTAIRWKGKYWEAHRLSFHLNNKRISYLANKKWVLHTCDNDWCVNPDHLYTGTAANNFYDRLERFPNMREMLSSYTKNIPKSKDHKKKIGRSNKKTWKSSELRRMASEQKKLYWKRRKADAMEPAT